MKQALIGSAALLGAAQGLDYICTPSAIQAALPAGASVNFAYPVAANATFEVPASDTGYPDSPPSLPALCAASIQVQSIRNTTFGFGIFLPEDWNGRFLAVGNGGFAGGINYVDMVTSITALNLASANVIPGCWCALRFCCCVNRHRTQLHHV